MIDCIVPEIKKKMTNLRTYYAKELWKVKKHEIKAETDHYSTKVYNSRWIFFKPLDFLRDNCNPKPKVEDDDSRNLSTLDDVDDSREQWDDTTLNLVALTTENGNKDDSKDDDDDGLSNEHIEIGEHSPISMVPISSLNTDSPKLPDRNLRKRTGDDLESVIAKLRRTNDKSETKTQAKNIANPRIDLTSYDPDMVFAHHVGLSLSKIKDMKTKDLAKLKIQQVLFETQYGTNSVQSVEVQAFPIVN